MMNLSLHHRGPDDTNYWISPDQMLAFGHNRLAIIDTSENGSQPMLSHSKRYVIVFNGEIYNHLELRKELELVNHSLSWRGHSDTETILAGFEIWGIQKTISKMFGMFAMAIWDHQNKILSLTRDRIGEKPLYYFQSNDLLTFASEPKAFFNVEDFKSQTAIDQGAIYEFLKFSYVPDSSSIFQSVHKVKPGTILSFGNIHSTPEEFCYWSMSEVISTKKRDTNHNSQSFYEEGLESTLSSVIQSQMISDVPIGSFLSGGIDSTLITLLMQKSSSIPVQTFSIGFKEARFNESEYAADIAHFLKTNHTEFIVDEMDILNIIPSLPEIYDEPFADSSQLPTILLSKLAKENVTVALTGDGGDEVFGGYNRHIFGPKLWKLLSFFSPRVKIILSRMISFLNVVKYQDTALIKSLIQKIGLPITFLERIAVLQRGLEEAKNFQELHLILASAFSDPADLIRFNNSKIMQLNYPYIFDNVDLSYAEKMMAYDTVSYLPGDILVKVDRASMHSSLETRAPFLDKRVIEYGWDIPIQYKIENKTGKKILRNILDKYIPQELTNRPKQGFSIPIDKWLRGDLYDWADQLLSTDMLNEFQTLNVKPIKKLWSEHSSLKANHGQQLWTILMLQSWLEHYNKNFLK